MCLGQEPNIKSHNLQFKHCPGLFLCKGCLWEDNWGVLEFINDLKDNFCFLQGCLKDYESFVGNSKDCEGKPVTDCR